MPCSPGPWARSQWEPLLPDCSAIVQVPLPRREIQVALLTLTLTADLAGRRTTGRGESGFSGRFLVSCRRHWRLKIADDSSPGTSLTGWHSKVDEGNGPVPAVNGWVWAICCDTVYLIRNSLCRCAQYSQPVHGSPDRGFTALALPVHQSDEENRYGLQPAGQGFCSP